MTIGWRVSCVVYALIRYVQRHAGASMTSLTDRSQMSPFWHPNRQLSSFLDGTSQFCQLVARIYANVMYEVLHSRLADQDTGPRPNIGRNWLDYGSGEQTAVGLPFLWTHFAVPDYMACQTDVAYSCIREGKLWSFACRVLYWSVKPWNSIFECHCRPIVSVLVAKKTRQLVIGEQ